MERVCVCVGIYCMYDLVCVRACVCVCVCVFGGRGVHGLRNAMEPSPSSCAARRAGPTAPAAMCGATEPPKAAADSESSCHVQAHMQRPARAS